MRIDVDLSGDITEARRRELLDAEAERGRELLKSGALRRIWRVPGRSSNVSLYAAADATELHALLTSLPLWPWMDVHVEALATHPLEAT